MSNTSIRLNPGFTLTPDIEQAYRQAKRHYAEQDVRHVCGELGVQLSEWEIQEVADRYDTWQGDNPFWHETLACFIHDAEEAHSGVDYGCGIEIEGVLQVFDLYGDRADMWKAQFTIPANIAVNLSEPQLAALHDNPTVYSADDGNALTSFVMMAYGNHWFGNGIAWEWGDPFEFSANTEQVQFYLDRLENVRL